MNLFQIRRPRWSFPALHGTTRIRPQLPEAAAKLELSHGYLIGRDITPVGDTARGL
jgi:hypothetical protein